MSTNVLIVDDDADLVEVLRTALEMAGYAVAAAYTGEEGLARARSDKPDVTVLDVTMETAGAGFRVAREMRADPALRDMPLIMLTSINQDEASLRYGVDEDWNPVDVFLDKPVEPRRLVEEIKRVTGGGEA